MKPKIFISNAVIISTRTALKYSTILYITTVSLLVFLLAAPGCKKNNPQQIATTYAQVNLVADDASLGAARVDALFKNGWGIAISPNNGIYWIADNYTGVTSVYDSGGNQVLAAVDIPFGGNPTGGRPTGAVYNGTSDFKHNAQASRFIYATENGTIAVWNSGTSCTTVADQSASGSVYKGLALASVGSSNFLYAADFHNNKIDVYDSAFNLITLPFADPNMPAGFAPFNVQLIGSQLYVAYAKQAADSTYDQAGAGNGYVDVFTTGGTFVKRFASQGTLNSPWGVVQAPAGFGAGANSILIGNFGDGRINVFDASGNYQGQLKDSNGNAIYIYGLWALYFPQNAAAGDPNHLYFTAGPGGGIHGIFGYIKIK